MVAVELAARPRPPPLLSDRPLLLPSDSAGTAGRHRQNGLAVVAGGSPHKTHRSICLSVGQIDSDGERRRGETPREDEKGREKQKEEDERLGSPRLNRRSDFWTDVRGRADVPPTDRSRSDGRDE